MENFGDKLGYMLGNDIGTQFKTMPVEFNLEKFFEAIKDVVEGNESKLSDEDKMAVQQELQLKMTEVSNTAASANGEIGEKFLAENKAKDGVVETETGLQYEVLVEGDGEKPESAESEVTVHYEGKLLDGTVFDSSVARNEPASFPLNRVIKGWTEGVQLMSIGSKYRFFIPAELAYGPQGAGGQIGPNATLVFEVELLAIK